MKVRIQRHNNSIDFQCKYEDLVVGSLTHADSSDVQAFMSEITQTGGCIHRSPDRLPGTRLRSSGRSAFCRAVLEVRGSERKGLPYVFRIELRIVPEKVLVIRIGRHGFYNSAHRQPHPPDARLSVHLVRSPRDAIKALHTAYSDTFLGRYRTAPNCQPLASPKALENSSQSHTRRLRWRPHLAIGITQDFAAAPSSQAVNCVALRRLKTTCCIVGGGPAGIMLGYLLACAGVRVNVLEKHNDFFRDFRGDTVHPSTLDVMHQLGLLDGLLQLPHQRVTFVGARIGDYNFEAADFRFLPTHCKFVALMPQWDFLNYLSERANRFDGFELLMHREATGLTRDDHESHRINGVEAQSPKTGPVRIEADLVVACDGRHSTIRQSAQLPVQEFGVPIPSPA